MGALVLLSALVLLRARAPDAWLQLRVLLQSLWHARHNGKLYARARHEGILDALKHEPEAAPFGFSRGVSWTTEPPTDPSTKHDALPVHVVEMLLPHDSWTGARLGTSLFIDASNDRMRRKRMYLAALTTTAVDTEYVPAMERHLQAMNEDADPLRAMAALTWELHTGSQATEEELAATVGMAEALTRALHSPWVLWDAGAHREVLRRGIRNGMGGMVARWRIAGMHEDDVYAEFAHNLFGMTLQWAYVLVRMSQTRERRPDTLEEAAAFILDTLPARAAASRVDDRLVVHDLAEVCPHARRPVVFGTPDPPGIADQPIGGPNDDAYVPFGMGARRCPGEWLTYLFVLCAARYAPEGGATGRSRWLGLNRI